MLYIIYNINISLGMGWGYLKRLPKATCSKWREYGRAPTTRVVCHFEHVDFGPVLKRIRRIILYYEPAKYNIFISISLYFICGDDKIYNL